METPLQRIQGKLKELLKRHQTALKERDRLLEENRALLGKLQEQENQLRELLITRDARHLSEQITDDARKKEVEKKLNQYIKEIDRCITLLAE